MAKKLHYFNVNGIAESIRYLLHYAGEEFEDIRYERSEWPILSVKNKMPYGQMPLYEDGDKSLNQSLAIARYVASKTDLLPSDPWQQAILDSAVFNIYDFWAKAVTCIREKEPAQKAIYKKQLLEEAVPFFLSRFEKELKDSNGHFGGKLSWADFILVGIVEAVNLIFSTTIDKDYPTVTALIKTVRSQPGVKEYLASKSPYIYN